MILLLISYFSETGSPWHPACGTVVQSMQPGTPGLKSYFQVFVWDMVFIYKEQSEKNYFVILSLLWNFYTKCSQQPLCPQKPQKNILSIILNRLTWILILTENGIQSVWKPLMDYEILTCSPILHEQEFPLEILTESETPNKEDSITNGTGHVDA